MLIIKPKDDSTKIGFRNSEWQLEVTYEYTELVDEDPVGLAENEDCENIWPLINNETIFYSPAGFNIEQEEDRVEISNVNAKAVKVLAGFTDEEGRLMSVVATKLCTMVTKIYCRNVDIHYKYAAPATGLIPHVRIMNTLVIMGSCGIHFKHVMVWLFFILVLQKLLIVRHLMGKYVVRKCIGTTIVFVARRNIKHSLWVVLVIGRQIVM
jgi:hypothetical protein